MNTFLYVEFIADSENQTRLENEITAIGDDFILLSVNHGAAFCKINGQIHAESAAILALSNRFMSERMKVSYLSSDVKDKYRNR